MRVAGSLACLILLAGFAPMKMEGQSSAREAPRRCFASTDLRLVKFEPGSGVVVRTRSGQALELSGPGPCLDVTDNPRIGLRPLGLDGADVCIGDSARLDIRSQASIERTCNVRVARIVPESEIARIPDRRP